MRLEQTIPLPGVTGRIDHLAFDEKRGRLFVAALGNNTIEVVDTRAGKHVLSLSGVREPQGIALDSKSTRVFVASGATGSVHVFDAGTLRPLPPLRLGDDADNVRFDATAGRVYVGFGEGGLAVLNGGDGSLRFLIPLSGHPESFQLEAAGPRVFVNVPSKGQIAVADRKAGRVVATWPVPGGAAANFPMTLDEANRRLLIGCRNPAVLLVLDLDSGKQVARVEIAGDTDDVFWDARANRAYVSCGAGFLDVIARQGADRYEAVSHLPTAPGARTSLFVPGADRLYLAVPRRGAQSAEIRAYSTRD